MCCVSKCRNIVDGKGCHHCEGLSKNDIPVPYDTALGKCMCALCMCQCNIAFAKTNWQGIAAQTEMDENAKKKAKPFTSDQEGK